MTDEQHDAPDIPPAITEFGWKEIAAQGGALMQFFAQRGNIVIGKPDGEAHGPFRQADVNHLAYIIALANAAMNDEDPRKFRREHVAAIRAGARRLVLDSAPFTTRKLDEDWLHELADALESYLPPLTIPAPG